MLSLSFSCVTLFWSDFACFLPFVSLYVVVCFWVLRSLFTLCLAFPSFYFTSEGRTCMYAYHCHFFFFGHTSLCSHLIRNVRWGGHNSTQAVTLLAVWARSVQCLAFPSFYITSEGRTCMYAYHCQFFFFGHTSSCSHLIRNVRWGGHDSTHAVTLLAVWARSVQCLARGMLFSNCFGLGHAFKTFLALGTYKANPRVSATSPGIRFPHPLSRCTHVRIGCKPGFSARGYTYIALFLHRAPRYDPAAQQQSSPHQ